MTDVIKPTITADQWAADPAGALSATVDFITKLPEASHFWGYAITGGLAALVVVQKLAPMIPGVGPLVQSGVDLVWQALSHSNATQEDQAKAIISEGAPALLQLVTAAKASPELAKFVPPKVEAALTQLAS